MALQSGATGKKRLFGAVMIVVMLFLVVAGILISSLLEQQNDQEAREEMSDGFGRLPTLIYQGKTYQAKPNLSSILLIGYKLSPEEIRGLGYRGHGLADFMMLVVIDHHSKEVRLLALDRDTMTDVEILGVTGRPVGTRKLHLCMAHSYGLTILENDIQTRKAVEFLLQGVPIDGTVSMDVSSVGVLNHLLGGVPVRITDDFSAYDPAMVPGAELVLSDDQAQMFVHSRMTIGDGKNSSRMRRQRVYISSAYNVMRTRLREDGGFAKELLLAMDQELVSSLPQGRLINEMTSAATYKVLPLETLEGEHILGEDGFEEFHVTDEAVMSWVLTAFYNPME